MNAGRVIATGAAIGLVLSAVFGRLIETMLFGVRPLDLATFAFVTIVVGITAALRLPAPPGVPSASTRHRPRSRNT